MKRKKLKQIRITSFMFVLLVIGTACAGNTNKVNNTDLKEKENKEMAKELTKKTSLRKYIILKQILKNGNLKGINLV